MKNKSSSSDPFSLKSWKETEKLSKMPQDKYEKAARSLTYMDELAAMRPVSKPKAGEQDSGEYSNYMQKVKELNAGIKAGGDYGKQQKILENQRLLDINRSNYEWLKSKGALSWMPQSFEEYMDEKKRIDEIEKQSIQNEAANRYQNSLADAYERASRGQIIAMRPPGPLFG